MLPYRDHPSCYPQEEVGKKVCRGKPPQRRLSRSLLGALRFLLFHPIPSKRRISVIPTSLYTAQPGRPRLGKCYSHRRDGFASCVHFVHLQPRGTNSHTRQWSSPPPPTYPGHNQGDERGATHHEGRAKRSADTTRESFKQPILRNPDADLISSPSLPTFSPPSSLPPRF